MGERGARTGRQLLLVIGGRDSAAVIVDAVCQCGCSRRSADHLPGHHRDWGACERDVRAVEGEAPVC